MKPLLLKGHERSITRIRLNREGDILFSAAKDKSICVYYVDNGERVGTYEGHRGAIWDVDVTWDTRTLVSAGADGTVKVWDVETGEKTRDVLLTDQSVARATAMSYSGKMAAIVALKPSIVYLLDLREGSNSGTKFFAQIDLSINSTCCVFSHLDDGLVIGGEDGSLLLYDLRNLSDSSNFSKPHDGKAVKDLQVSEHQGFIISASADKTAQLHNARDLAHLKTYKSGRPVNSAAISPKRDHIVLGGGEEAMGVTQTAAASGQFEAKLYHMIYEDEFARFKGHFGPINSLCFHPSGSTIITGGEDGYVRIQDLGEPYLNFEFDY